MSQISIITPTVRPEGLQQVKRALRRQTFTDIEWIVICPESRLLQVNDILKDESADITVLVEPPRAPEDVWALNKAYNKAIKQSGGELIVSWQDFTYAKPDTLERLWNHYQDEPKTLVGAVGNKYSDRDLTVQVWQDPRENNNHGTFYPCYFSDIEWNLCSVPKQALLDVGGFDEELDKFFGMDGYSVNARIHLIGGYDFKLDQSIKSYSLVHDRPDQWEEKNAIHGPYQERSSFYLQYPKLPYLD